MSERAAPATDEREKSPRPKSVSGQASYGMLEEEFPNLSLYQRERRPSANAILQSTSPRNSITTTPSITPSITPLIAPTHSYAYYGEEVTTIHVAGLPEDVTEREFVNMFMFAPGFETAVLRYNHNPATLPCNAFNQNGEEEEEQHLHSNSQLHNQPLHNQSPHSQLHNQSPHSQLLNQSHYSQQHSSQQHELGSPFTIGLPPLIKSQPLQQPVAETIVVGFARFQTRQDALDARDHLNGKAMDTGKSVLRVELARKNLLMPLLSQGSYTIPISKSELLQQQQQQQQTQQVPRRQSFAGSIPIMSSNEFLFSPYPPSEMSCYSPSVSACSLDGLNSPTTANFFPPVPRPQLPPQVSANGGRHSISAKLVATTAAYPGVPPALIVGENPPCNTLYVGNLPITATEEELWVLFSPCRGFKRLSFRLKPNGPMCFVEFEDIACATEAMETLYGTMLSCSVKGGIRLSYSKNPLGVRASVPQTPVYQSNLNIIIGGGGEDECNNGFSGLLVESPVSQPNANP